MLSRAKDQLNRFPQAILGVPVGARRPSKYVSGWHGRGCPSFPMAFDDPVEAARAEVRARLPDHGRLAGARCA